MRPREGRSNPLANTPSSRPPLLLRGAVLLPSAAVRGAPPDPAMTDTLPDRLCADPKSKFHDADLMERGVGIRFNGVERHDVHEYCLSEGWIKVPAGTALDRRGQPLTFTLRGKVEAWIKSPGDESTA
jgi:hypothetical protein